MIDLGRDALKVPVPSNHRWSSPLRETSIVQTTRNDPRLRNKAKLNFIGTPDKSFLSRTISCSCHLVKALLPHSSFINMPSPFCARVFEGTRPLTKPFLHETKRGICHDEVVSLSRFKYQQPPTLSTVPYIMLERYCLIIVHQPKRTRPKYH